MNYTVPFAPPAGSFHPVPPAGPTRSTRSAYDDRAERSLPLVYPPFSDQFRHTLTYNINMLWLNCRFTDEIYTVITEGGRIEETHYQLCSRILAMERQISVIDSTAGRWNDTMDNLKEPFRTAEYRYKDRFFHDLCEEINELNEIEDIDPSRAEYIDKYSILSDAVSFLTTLKLCAEYYANREPQVQMPTTAAPSRGPRQDCSDTANGKNMKSTASTTSDSPRQSPPIEAWTEELHHSQAVSNELKAPYAISNRARVSSDVRSYPERFSSQLSRSPSTTSSEDGLLEDRSQSEPPVPSEFLDSPPLLLHGSISNQISIHSKQSIDEQEEETRKREEITADDKHGESPAKNGIGECHEIKGSKATISPLTISIPSPEFLPCTDHLLIEENFSIDLSTSNSEKTTDLHEDSTPISTVSINDSLPSFDLTSDQTPSPTSSTLQTISDSLPSVALISGSLPTASPIYHSLDDSEGEMIEMEEIFDGDKDDTSETRKGSTEENRWNIRGIEQPNTAILPFTVLTPSLASFTEERHQLVDPSSLVAFNNSSVPSTPIVAVPSNLFTTFVIHDQDEKRASSADISPRHTRPLTNAIIVEMQENERRGVGEKSEMSHSLTGDREKDERTMTHHRTSNDEEEIMREGALTHKRREENCEGSSETSISYLRFDENTTSSFMTLELERESNSSGLPPLPMPKENEMHENKDIAHLTEEPSRMTPALPSPCSTILLLSNRQVTAMSAEAKEQFTAIFIPTLNVNRMKTEMSSAPLCLKSVEEKMEKRKDKGSEFKESETEQFMCPNTTLLYIDCQQSLVTFTGVQELQEDPMRDVSRGDIVTYPTEKNEEKEPPDRESDAKDISRKFHSLSTEEEITESPDRPLSSLARLPPLSLLSSSSTTREGEDRGAAILPDAPLPQEEEPPDHSLASEESVHSNEARSTILKNRRDIQEKPKFGYLNRTFILTEEYLWNVLFAVTLWLLTFIRLARLRCPGRARVQRDKRKESCLGNCLSLVSFMDGVNEAPDKGADLDSEMDGEEDEKPIKDCQEAHPSKCLKSFHPGDCPSPASNLHSTIYGEAPSAHQKRWRSDPSIQEYPPAVDIEGMEESLRETTSAHNDDSDHTVNRMTLPPEKIAKWSLRLAGDPRKKREYEKEIELQCINAALMMNSRGKLSKISDGIECIALPSDIALINDLLDLRSTSRLRLRSHIYSWKWLLLPRTNQPLTSLISLSVLSVYCTWSDQQPGENMLLTDLLFEKGFKEPLEPPNRWIHSAGTGNFFFWYPCSLRTKLDKSMITMELHEMEEQLFDLIATREQIWIAPDECIDRENVVDENTTEDQSPSEESTSIRRTDLTYWSLPLLPSSKALDVIVSCLLTTTFPFEMKNEVSWNELTRSFPDSPDYSSSPSCFYGSPDYSPVSPCTFHGSPDCSPSSPGYPGHCEETSSHDPAQEENALQMNLHTFEPP